MTDITNASTANFEHTFTENAFGTVTSKRLVFYSAKGWVSGGSRQDVPLQNVTSARLDISRSIFAGILLIIIGGSCLSSGNLVAAIVSLVGIFFGVLLVQASPTVVVDTSGQDLNVAKGWPWVRGEANAFVDECAGSCSDRNYYRPDSPKGVCEPEKRHKGIDGTRKRSSVCRGFDFCLRSVRVSG